MIDICAVGANAARCGCAAGAGAVLLAAVLLAPASQPATARTIHPWCMIIQDWSGGWACAFDSFAQCHAEAAAGHTGFCAANPAYPDTREQAPPPRKRRHRR
jgi:hypothetical protein